MGGSIIVGVRLTNGKEYLTNRWTNCTAWELADPDFFDENSRVFKDWLMRAITNISKEKYGYDHVINKLKNVSYGIILIDFKQPAIWSENGYCNPGGYYINNHDSSFEDEIDLLCKLQDKGWIGTIEQGYIPGNPLSKEDISIYLDHAQKKDYEWLSEYHSNKLEHLGLRININRIGFDFTHVLDGKRGIIPRAKKWGQSRGWKTL